MKANRAHDEIESSRQTRRSRGGGIGPAPGGQDGTEPSEDDHRDEAVDEVAAAVERDPGETDDAVEPGEEAADPDADPVE